MTTVIACRSLNTMMADTRVSHGEVRFKNSKKIQRVGKYIVGVAGDFSHALGYVQQFIAQAKTMDGRSVPKLEKMDGEFEMLVLSEHGLFLYGDDGRPLDVEEEFYVIGTGAVPASVCLATQERTCTAYDLVMAMEMACEYDNDTGLPAVTITLGKKKATE